MNKKILVEGGKMMELLLFGQVVNGLSREQAIFILD